MEFRAGVGTLDGRQKLRETFIDEMRAVELYVTGLGPTYIGIRTEGRSLNGVIEETRQMERRHVRHRTIPDPYMGSSTKFEVVQSV